MNLKQYYQTKNDCYKAGKQIVVKGLMLHSTGANNPKLSRYVGPDDGILGKNPNNNDWNRSGITKCVHGFIGKDKDGNVRTYQTLPWNYRGWHAGGKANDSYIGLEICEDDLKDPVYFKKAYVEAVEVYAFLANKFGLTEKNIIDHKEGHKKGIASNHGDVMHWFPKHGKSMDTFRNDVKYLLDVQYNKTKKPADVKVTVDTNATANPTKVVVKPVEKTINQLAVEVIQGLHGSGRERMISLGDKYSAVQQEVNRLLRVVK